MNGEDNGIEIVPLADPPSGRLLVVGDVHGQAEALGRVLEAAAYRPGEDGLILLGDLNDRGPDTRGAVRLAMDLERDGACVLLGNHHLMPMEVWAGLMSSWDWLEFNGGRFTRESYYNHIPEDDLRWLATRPAAATWRDFVFVHAGLRPGIPLEEQSLDDLVWIREEFFNVWRGPQVVVHGHTVLSDQPAAGPWRISMDTGAGNDGALSILDVPSLRFWQWDIRTRALREGVCPSYVAV